MEDTLTAETDWEERIGMAEEQGEVDALGLESG